jgi:uncharacterized membrane protein (UPF0127 family)
METTSTLATDTITVRRDDGAVMCERCVVADSPTSRARGLLGRGSLGGGEGLLLRPASSIHTWFMRFPIDAVFLAEDGQVVRVSDDLRPWRFAGRRGARAVLELPSGECERRGLRAGDRLVLA